MAGTTPIYGIPYPESSDLVANYPALGESLAETLEDALESKAPTLDLGRTITTDITLALSDAFTVFTITGSTGYNVTVPPNASVNFPTGTVIEIWQQSSAIATLVAGSGVTLFASTLVTPGTHLGLRLLKMATDAWWVTPFSSGAGNADFSNAATGTYTDSGIDYKYILFTATGTLTVTKPGFADIFMIGGGGGGGGTNGGGGGGGGMLDYGVLLPAGSLTVTIGAGGAGGAASTINVRGSGGTFSQITGFDIPTGTIGLKTNGGGGGANFSNTTNPGQTGGCGGGGGGSDFTLYSVGGGNYNRQGLYGGNGGVNPSTNSGGGGGGSAAPGVAAAGSTAGAGGAGAITLIEGAARSAAAGGGGGSNVTAAAGGGSGAGNGSTGTGGSASANSGGGGGGGGATSAGGAGGSGLVIVRVRTN